MYFIYILTNKIHTVLYIGVTNNLSKRVYEHKQKFIDGFSRKYNLTKLVYFETFNEIVDAIIREKRLKKWKRKWKEDLINKKNSEWKDLTSELKYYQ